MSTPLAPPREAMLWTLAGSLCRLIRDGAVSVDELEDLLGDLRAAVGDYPQLPLFVAYLDARDHERRAA